MYKSKNAASLSEQEREKVKLLLDLYNTWQKSSYTVAGREDSMLINDDGKLYGVYKGEVFEIGGAGAGMSTNLSKQVMNKSAKEVIIKKPKPIREIKPEAERIKVRAIKKESVQTCSQARW